jgi:hypothetical protein
VLGDLGCEEIVVERAQPLVRAALVTFHQPRIADDVGHDDGDELAVDRHRRRPSSGLIATD